MRESGSSNFNNIDEQRAFTIDEWCRENRISRGTFYNLKSQGKAPAFIMIGNRPIITRRAHLDWLAEREAAAAEEHKAACERKSAARARAASDKARAKIVAAQMECNARPKPSPNSPCVVKHCASKKPLLAKHKLCGLEPSKQ